MDKKAAYVEKLRAQLREWDGLWQVAKARLAKRKADAKLESIDVLNGLAERRAALAKELEKLEASAGDSWESLKSHATDLWSELESRLATLRSKLGDSDSEDKPK